MIEVALIVQKSIAGHFEQNIASSLEYISSAVKKKAKIVVFPEMNLTGYVAGSQIKSICKPIDKKIIAVFSNLAKTHKIDILVGLAEHSSDNKIYASHLIFNTDASFKVYRKIHTAPFEKKYFTPGNKIIMFNTQGFNCGIQLCYDAHFPELSLAMALRKADIIFIPHASPRGTSQEKYDSWTRHLRARAFDNGLYIAACNQTGDNEKGLIFPGISLLIGPDGNIIYRSNNIVDGNTTDGNSAEGIHMIKIEKAALNHVRSHKMRYFLPHRRNDLFGF